MKNWHIILNLILYTRKALEYIKNRLKGIALPSYYGYDSQALPLNISKAEVSTLHKLCRNKNIVITRPDKGNGIVILNRHDYVSKAINSLQDLSKFAPLRSDILDLCLKRENRLVRFLRDTLLQQKCISEKVYHDLYQTASTPGILYGLPTVHKTGCPVRPILSSIGTFIYKVIYLFMTLSPLLWTFPLFLILTIVWLASMLSACLLIFL